MLLYKDIITGDEVCTDIQKITYEQQGELMYVACKEVKRTENTDFNIGANASQEEQGEEYESQVTMGIDVVLNHKLEEVTNLYNKPKDYISETQLYLKKVAKLVPVEKRGEYASAVNFFLKTFIKDNFDELQFFRPEIDYEKNEEPPLPFVIPFLRDSQNNLTMVFFTQALQEEKC